MGGSILGSKAIYQFLSHKIKKNFFFVDNLRTTLDLHKKKKIVNLIISKSIFTESAQIASKPHGII